MNHLEQEQARARRETLEGIDEEVRRLNPDPEWRHKMITLEEKRLIHAQNLVDEAVEEATRRVTEQVRTDDLGLYEQLERAGRLSEYKRALTDDGFRKELESELGLWVRRARDAQRARHGDRQESVPFFVPGTYGVNVTP